MQEDKAVNITKEKHTIARARTHTHTYKHIQTNKHINTGPADAQLLRHHLYHRQHMYVSSLRFGNSHRAATFCFEILVLDQRNFETSYDTIVLCLSA